MRHHIICDVCASQRTYPVIELRLPTGQWVFCSISCYDKYQKVEETAKTSIRGIQSYEAFCTFCQTKKLHYILSASVLKCGSCGLPRTYSMDSP